MKSYRSQGALVGNQAEISVSRGFENAVGLWLAMHGNRHCLLKQNDIIKSINESIKPSDTMKICYFSGTGNSYYAAKHIAKNFSESKIFSISGSSDTAETVIKDEELVIVCPVYYYSIPPVVERFFGGLVLKGSVKLTFILTAEFPNGIAVQHIKRICRTKNVNLNRCFYLGMPTNYLMKSRMLSSGEIDSTLSRADRKLTRIAEYIRTGKKHIDRDSVLYSLIMRARNNYKQWQTKYSVFDTEFSVSERCRGCKLCETHCPSNNISVNKNPVWHHRCKACLKCINICPEEAIDYENKTNGKLRYFNPRVSLSEFK